MMRDIPDDPIIASMLRTGYPPWIDADYEEIDEDENLEEQQEGDQE